MQRVLVDTSVWIDHFRHPNAALIALLHADLVLVHPMVLLELACGTPPAPRSQTLDNIALLQPAQQVSYSELRDLIERDKLYGLGCGLVDVTLLASTRLTPGAELWTQDKRLAQLANRFGVMHRPALH